jgi:hypothetical protein
MLQTKFVAKIRTHFMFSNFFRNSCRLWVDVEKYSGAREATNDNTKQCFQIPCWMSKATRACAHAHYQTFGHAPARYACAHTHTHTHTHIYIYIYNTFCFSTKTKIHERALMLRYTRIACLVTETECVYCAVRKLTLYTGNRVNSLLQVCPEFWV